MQVSEQRPVVWFSCGVASAVVAKLAVEEYGPDGVTVVYCDTMDDEHPDNLRFFKDVEQWIGLPITVIRSNKYNGIEDVFEARKYMSGVAGAPCTVEMKKVPRFDFQTADDLHMFGYTADEVARVARFEQNNHELYLRWILIERGLDKQACLDFIAEAGIELPMMYRLGYKNNNCIGCVKASSTKYWNQIRKDFPQIWLNRAEQSRRIGAKLTRINGKRVFLDELPPDEDDGLLENISCGPECADEEVGVDAGQ